MDSPLLETLAENADAPRAFRRFSLNFAIEVSLSADKTIPRAASPAKVPATMIDASMSGFSFTSLFEFPEGSVIQMDLTLGSQAHRVPALLRRRVSEKRLGRNIYEYGAQFVKSDSTLRFLPLMARYLMTRNDEDHGVAHKT